MLLGKGRQLQKLFAGEYFAGRVERIAETDQLGSRSQQRLHRIKIHAIGSGGYRKPNRYTTHGFYRIGKQEINRIENNGLVPFIQQCFTSEVDTKGSTVDRQYTFHPHRIGSTSLHVGSHGLPKREITFGSRIRIIVRGGISSNGLRDHFCRRKIRISRS